MFLGDWLQRRAMLTPGKVVLVMRCRESADHVPAVGSVRESDGPAAQIARGGEAAPGGGAGA